MLVLSMLLSRSLINKSLRAVVLVCHRARVEDIRMLSCVSLGVPFRRKRTSALILVLEWARITDVVLSVLVLVGASRVLACERLCTLIPF